MRDDSSLTRRRLLATGLTTGGALALGPAFWRQALAAPARVAEGPYGPLGDFDGATGLALPRGFSSRVVALSGQPVAGTGYELPPSPDGQATFALPDGGWILVTNAETLGVLGGGASAIRFAGDGQPRAAYRILANTNVNCAGGPTPWGTWMSCEEVDTDDFVPGLSILAGQVWECDPTGSTPAQARPAMGRFKHEAIAVDPAGQRIYLSEDQSDGLFYRFTPTNYPDTASGVLEAAVVGEGGAVTWATVPDPLAITGPLRNQVPPATRFRRGEGMWFDAGIVYLATTSDAKVHAYDTARETIDVVYDKAAVGGDDAILTGIDNISVSPSGDLFVAEDNGAEAFDIGIVTPEGTVSRFVTADGRAGAPHAGSEFCGPVFSPDGSRLYVTSQRGFGVGAILEITGPFRTRRPAAPGFGQPGGSSPPTAGGRPALPSPAIGLEVPRQIMLSTLRRRGIPLVVTLDGPATVSVRAVAAFAPARRSRGRRRARRLLSSARRRLTSGGRQTLRLRLRPEGRRALEGRRGNLRVTLEITITDARGRRGRVQRTVVVRAPR